MPTPLQPVKAGDTIQVPPDAYCFGTETLVLQVTSAGPPFVFHGRAWWQEVRGLEVCRCGKDHDRVATVRVDAVRKVPEQRPAT
jgi:hypothetical protein